MDTRWELYAHDACRKNARAGDIKPQKLLTKGDNNELNDIQLYNGLEFLERKHIVGKVRG